MAIVWLVWLVMLLLGGPVLVIYWLARRRADIVKGKATRKSWRARFNSLQWRMTFSYIWLTIVSILVAFLLINSFSFLLIPLALVAGVVFWLKNRRRGTLPDWRASLALLRPRLSCSFIGLAAIAITLVLIMIGSIGSLLSLLTPPAEQVSSQANDLTIVKQVAEQYASSIERQTRNFPPGELLPYPLGEPLTSDPDTYDDASALSDLKDDVVPYLPRLYAHQAVSFALLISLDQQILSSSYPALYTPGKQINTLLPEQSAWIMRALQGQEQQGNFTDMQGKMVYAAVGIFGRNRQIIGAIYVQAPVSTLHATLPDNSLSLPGSLLALVLILVFLLIVLVPLGGIFGFFSTRGLVKRLKMLAEATTAVANGDYQPRLAIGSQDEIGQLELQFNRMTEQLGESVARQQSLAEENARLAERSRISRELHDAISQDLFSLSMLAGGLQSALPADSPLQRQAVMLEQTTNSTIREMRALLLELRPTRLEQLSLVAALQELATAYSTRLGIQVKAELTPLELEANKEHTILRIAQEALANAARHASATEISLLLTRQNGQALFCIRDNGKGFQASAESLRHGLGLRMMQERVQELHGTFSLESAPDQGTSLEIHLPLEEQ